jgi:regulator of protease activity HflC (stomatin/prohibitin superfamily)
MPFMFYAALLFGIVALILIIKGPITIDGETANMRGFGFFLLIIALAFTALSSFTVVGTRNVGVEKFFSATTGRTLGAGIHAKAPWMTVKDIDATIQIEEYDTNNPILVKIGDQGEAKVALAYRWRINPEGAAQVYKDYRNAEDITAAVRSALVSTNIKAALNEELGTYNPMADVQIDASMTPSEIAQVTIPPIPYADLNDAVKRNLEDKIKDLGDLIDIQSVTISYLQLPESTQKKINDFNAKVQESKNTLIDIATKTAQATANGKLAKSVNNSPNVLVSKCFDALADGDFQAPAGFSCWPGGGGAVVVPSGR